MTRQIVSFSGGKDSTAMLHMMLERNEPIDTVVFFDTGWEFDELYAHVDLVEKKTGITITRLHPRQPFDYFFAEKPRNSTKYPGALGYACPVYRCRWCTGEKMATLEKFTRSLGKVITCIGLAIGEERRIKNPTDIRYPLIEYGMTEREALQYCKSLGYDWGGLYDYRDRVSCWCCPLQSRVDLIHLQKFYPNYWERLVKMAEKQPLRPFKNKLTFQEYVEKYIP